MSSARNEEIAEDSILADYLRNNDAYITNSLRRIAAIPGLVGSGSVEEYAKHRAALKKCGAKIKTWMAVNTDWRSRCSQEAVERNIRSIWEGPSSFDIESEGIHMVFNNPAVAVELGLLEVLKVHIDEFGVDVTSRTWSGILTNDPEAGRDHRCLKLMHLALACDDQELLECVLNAHTFTMFYEIDSMGWFYDILTPGDVISLESVETLFLHGCVGINFQFYPERETPLLEILDTLRMQGDDADRHIELCERALAVLHVLLRCGADPEYDITRTSSNAIEELLMRDYDADNEAPMTPIDLARKLLSKSVMKPMVERNGWDINYLAKYIVVMEREGKDPCKKWQD